MARAGRIATHGSKSASEREMQVAQVMAQCPGAVTEGLSALVIDDLEGHLERELRAQGVKTTRWCRFSFGQQQGQAWPEAGPYDVVYLRLPRVKASFELALHAAWSVLAPQGQLWVYGANDEGIKSSPKLMEPLFGAVTTRDTRRHCRVLWTRRPSAEPAQGLRAPLSAHQQSIEALVGQGQWVSYPGVFARGALDDGTKMLLEVMPTPKPGERVLDFACGLGVIAAEALKRQPQAAVHMLEADAIALEAARQNVPQAKALLSDAWHQCGHDDFSLIVSNPPIHRGKSEDYEALLALIEGASARQRAGGQLWMVVQRQVPVAPLLEARYGQVEVVKQDGRFRVWCASKARG